MLYRQSRLNCVCEREIMFLCSLLVLPIPVFPNITFYFIVVPISSSTPRISHSNSIGPLTESACNLYGSSHLDSSMTLADWPKSMMRCGSFREQGDVGKSAWLPCRGDTQDGLRFKQSCPLVQQDNYWAYQYKC